EEGPVKWALETLIIDFAMVSTTGPSLRKVNWPAADLWFPGSSGYTSSLESLAEAVHPRGSSADPATEMDPSTDPSKLLPLVALEAPNHARTAAIDICEKRTVASPG